MSTDGLARRVAMAKLSLPICGDALGARLRRAWLRIASSPRRKLLLLVASTVLAALALWRGLYVAGLALLVPALPIVGPPLHQRFATRRTVRRLGGKPRSLEGLAPAELTLREMGIATEQAQQILALAGEQEYVIAEFDQNNRVLSHVGPIHLYADAIVTPEHFRKRSRNRMQIVVRDGVVAIRKEYSLYRRFANELISLDSLSAVRAVPKIIAVDLENRVLHQSYIQGKNLGSLLAARGATVSVQYRVGKAYSRHGEHAAGSLSDERSLLLRALHDTVDAEFITALERLFVEIHRAGVALRDIKHGNVLIYQGEPHWCDFDLSHRLNLDDAGFLLSRDRERDRFNYLFDGSLPTLESLERQLGSLRKVHEGSKPPVYFGKGFGSTKLSFMTGTGRWERVRNHLPPRVNRTAIIFGNEMCFAVGMLRAGAARAVMITEGSAHAKDAKLLQRCFELIDNREYRVDVLDGADLDQLAPDSVAGATIAVLATSDRSVEKLKQDGILADLAVVAETLVVDHIGGSARDQQDDPVVWLDQILGTRALPNRRAIRTPGFPGVLLIAARSSGF